MTDETIAVKSDTPLHPHYDSLVGTIPGVVYTLDEKGCFTSLSSGVETSIGTSAQSLIGRHFSTIVHPDDIKSVSRDYILPHFRGVPTGNERSPKLFDERRAWPRKTDSLSVRLYPESGAQEKKEQVFKCKVNASGRYNDRNEFCGTVGVIYDISDDACALSHMDKKKTYNAFELLTSALSHVFSNVFTGIYGNLQLIEMQLERPDEFQDNIEAIKHSVENAVTLIRKLSHTVSASERRSGGGYPVLLDGAAEELLAELEVKFTTSYAIGLWEPEADPAYINHILRAICYHITRSVRQHEQINISTRNLAEAPVRLPRHDCAYIMTNFSFSSQTAILFDSAQDECSSLERIASMALSYELLKKIGGHIRVDDSNGMTAVQLFLPAVR